ncbi:MAG TPA: CAP domain-containing protein [Gaiellales bacterium]|jgi:uncharacterized protein YkwD|nr:CAP domain-containing protein [Gaiellales bacterium]
MTRLLALLTALAAATAFLIAAGTASAASAPPRKALLHAINHARARHGLRGVRGSSILRGAAIRHSDDMIARDYFDHTSPSGSTFTSRIERTGFVSGYNWVAGETLAWGVGTRIRARSTVRAWLHSPEHRAILLAPTYRWVGMGRACGSFLGYTGACVWTVDWVKRW